MWSDSIRILNPYKETLKSLSELGNKSPNRIINKIEALALRKKQYARKV